MAHCVYLYAIGREEGPIKFGISDDPYKRARTLQTGCPFPISVLNRTLLPDRGTAEKEEELIHDLFRGHRLCGEWFDLGLELAIDGMAAIENSRPNKLWLVS